MDDRGIIRMLGVDLYKEGLRLRLAGGMGEPEDIGDGLFKIRTADGNIVIAGSEGGRYRHHCGCEGYHPCVHEAAALIVLYGEPVDDEIIESRDSRVTLAYVKDGIMRLSEMIERSDYDRWADEFGDDDDPESDHCLDMAMMENDSILANQARRICDDIRDRIGEPDNVVRMVQDLLDVSESNDVVMDEIRERLPVFIPLIPKASADALAYCYLHESDGDAGPWVDDHILGVPRETVDGLLDLLDASDLPEDAYYNVLFAGERYDDYVDTLFRDPKPVMKVVRTLAASGRMDEARHFAAMLPEPEMAGMMSRDISAILDDIGERDRATEYIVAQFLGDPTEEGMAAIMGRTDRHTVRGLNGMLLEAVRDRPASNKLAFLVEHGCGGEVDDIMRGLTDSGLAVMYSGRLFSSLMAHGRTEVAVLTARAYVSAVLEDRSTSEYYRAANALMYLDSVPPGTVVDGMDSEAFKRRMRKEHYRLNYFWSDYVDFGGSY